MLPRCLLVAGGWLLSLSVLAQVQPPTLDPLSSDVRALEAAVNKLQAQRTRGTWDDYGCVSDNPKVDNGPLLSRILLEQGRSIDVAPVGKARDYYVSSTIVWPKRHGGALVGAGGTTLLVRTRNPGVTRLIWNGPPNVPMIEYWGAGGRISQLVIQGALDATKTKPAAIGMLVYSDRNPPSGKLVTDQVTFANLDVGFKFIAEPVGNQGGTCKHYALAFHGVRIPYWVDNRQSVNHRFYDVEFRKGFETALRFDHGGALAVFGCYVGDNDGGTLLRIGTSSASNGCFEIYGLHCDGTGRRLTLVDHGKYAHRVRVSGSCAKLAIADPPVRQREGPSPFADVQIDCTNGVQWPKSRSP